MKTNHGEDGYALQTPASCNEKTTVWKHLEMITEIVNLSETFIAGRSKDGFSGRDILYYLENIH